MLRKIILLKRFIILTSLLTASLFSACSPETNHKPGPPSATPAARGGLLTPFASLTATVTPTPIDPSTATPLPTATPTPRTHTISKGEDMYGIAWRYGVSLEDLLAANPTIKPNMMSIGAVLIIPPATTPMPEAASSAVATITPVPLQMGRVTCSRAQDGGAWCFQPVQNPQPVPLESISAAFTYIDHQDQNMVSRTAFLLLDLLPPGATLPLVAYYPPPLPDPFQVSSELLSALPGQNDGRYLPTRIENTKVMMSENGLSAQVSLDVFLDIADSSAERIWVVAVAYDSQGNILGVRRWENKDAHPLESGQALPVMLQVYSTTGPIERVEAFAEARP